MVVNVGQAARIFPAEGTEFLNGQNYAAFQLPSPPLLAASFGSAALYLVEEIEGGYFTGCGRRRSRGCRFVLGHLYDEFVRSLGISALIVLLALPFDVRIESGVLGSSS